MTNAAAVKPPLLQSRPRARPAHSAPISVTSFIKQSPFSSRLTKPSWLSNLLSTHFPSFFRSPLSKSSLFYHNSLVRRPNASYPTIVATAITLFAILLLLLSFTVHNVPASASTKTTLPSTTSRQEFSSFLSKEGSPTRRGTSVDLSKARECERAVIFTGARQGSTWFIDSIQHCAYSTVDGQTGRRLFHPDVFRKTEIWKHFGEPGLDGTNITVPDALEYIVHNTSIKIFPSVFWRRRHDVARILQSRHEYQLSILVLRRDVEDTWHSWLHAQRSHVWNAASTNTTLSPSNSMHVSTDADEFEFPGILDPREMEHERQRQIANWSPQEYRERFSRFQESRKRFDKGVEQMLRENRVSYDIFDYDTVREMPIVLARNNRCFIRNCNFDNDAQLEALRKLRQWEAEEFSAYGQDLLEEERVGVRQAGAASVVLGG